MIPTQPGRETHLQFTGLGVMDEYDKVELKERLWAALHSRISQQASTGL